MPFLRAILQRRLPAGACEVDFSKPVRGGPLTAAGFDYYFGISGSLDMSPYCFIENRSGSCRLLRTRKLRSRRTLFYKSGLPESRPLGLDAQRLPECGGKPASLHRKPAERGPHHFSCICL